MQASTQQRRFPDACQSASAGPFRAVGGCRSVAIAAMARIALTMSSSLAFACVAAGCAGAATATATPASAMAPNCRDINADIARAEEASHAALEKKQDAWKAVIPFAVAARYASAKSDAEKAARQLQSLRADAARQGCDGLAS